MIATVKQQLLSIATVSLSLTVSALWTQNHFVTTTTTTTTRTIG